MWVLSPAIFWTMAVLAAIGLIVLVGLAMAYLGAAADNRDGTDAPGP
jgi:hypothetical protein